MLSAAREDVDGVLEMLLQFSGGISELCSISEASMN